MTAPKAFCLIVGTAALAFCLGFLQPTTTTMQQPMPQRRLTEESSNTVVGNNNNKWNPVHCPSYLKRARANDDGQTTTTINDPNDGELLARWTTTNPPFFASLHHFGYDKMRRVVYESGEYYERAQGNVFKTILEAAPPNSRVLDVGGNIGWFSLLSASLGHHVDVFEPNSANILRLCESMRLNEWDAVTTEDEIKSRTANRGSIHIRQYGVGSNTTNMTFYIGKNPGKATVLRSMLPKWRAVEEFTIQITPLDTVARDLQWIDANISIALLKVDVEGFEPSVFAGAKELLRAGLIQNIVMEVTSRPTNELNEEMLQTIVDSGYYPYQMGGALGSNGIQTGFPPRELFGETFMKRHFKKSGMQLNIWFKRGFMKD